MLVAYRGSLASIRVRIKFPQQLTKTGTFGAIFLFSFLPCLHSRQKKGKLATKIHEVYSFCTIITKKRMTFLSKKNRSIAEYFACVRTTSASLIVAIN